MSTSLDHRWSMVKEGTYNTPVTTTRFYPMLDDTDGDWDPRPRQSMAQQGGNGRRADLGSRRYLPIGKGAVKLKAELESKGGGVLLDWCFGASVVTAITGGTQQQYHLGIAGTLLPSATVQIVKVLNTGSETGAVETYAGVTPSKITIEQPEDDIASIMVEADARSVTTATAAAVTAYPVAPTIFDHWQGAVGMGGTLVAPTTTALASGLTPFADFRSWKLEIDQAIDDARWVIGSRNQPLAGKSKIRFTGKAEYNSTTVSVALIAGTKLPWYQTWTTTEVLGGGFAQMQLVLPKLSLTGKLPQTKAGGTTLQDVEADVTNDGTNRDLTLVIRTSDTVL